MSLLRLASVLSLCLATTRALQLQLPRIGISVGRYHVPLMTQALDRRDAMHIAGSAALLQLIRPQWAAAEEITTKSGLSYSIVKSGNGGQPTVGDLIAIRFKGAVKASGVVFDDIMTSSEPYYTRVGSGNVLPGVEEAVKLMHTGDVWDLTIPGNLAFGPKGRSASPGKPRIPSDATISFVLELVAVPGKDDEILEINDISE